MARPFVWVILKDVAVDIDGGNAIHDVKSLIECYRIQWSTTFLQTSITNIHLKC